jgi:hypothetical protein
MGLTWMRGTTCLDKMQVSRRDEDVPEGLENAILFVNSQLCIPPSEFSIELVRLCIRYLVPQSEGYLSLSSRSFTFIYDGS